MNKRKLNKRRQFSEQIRRKAVEEFRSGKYTVKELADLYHCSPQTIYRWIYKYSPGDSPSINVIEMSESTDQKVTDLQKKIAELEQVVGQKQIKVDFLQKMIELAEEEYDLDVKKSFSSKPSSGSESTGR
ncbi:MAG TPA: transposase [Halalkalibaculum sp.]|nr:transposase [Halalkalibaculum sp.]